MRFAVLGAVDSWYFRDLRRAAGDDYDVTPVTFRQLTAKASCDGERFHSQQTMLADYDALLVRTMPPGSLEQVVFRMDALARLEAAGATIVNPPRAIEAAVDKYLTTARLRAAGLCVPDTIVCQTTEDALAAFAELGGDVVVKPLFGAEGRGIARLADEALAERAFKLLEQLGAVIYLQRFVEHEGADLRLLVIGEDVLGMRRSNPLDWRTNVSRGAVAAAFVPDSELVDMARRAAESVGAVVAGVDLLPGRDGQVYAIEVNGVPGWKALAAAHNTDVARRVLNFVASVAASGRRR